MKVVFLFAISLFTISASSQTRDLTRWVNPFIGTGGHGHTFPGATVPFGMVQLSPDTRIDNWDGSSGYHYSDDIIYGFSHTHLSGTGIPDGCDILFMPTSDSSRKFGASIDYKQGSYEGFSSKFSHSDEVAEPGYYSVRINDRKLLVELTSTRRVGFHRYTFPRSKSAGVDLDLLWRDKTVDRDSKVIGSRWIEGYRRSSSWAKNQTVYFVVEVSKAFGVGAGGPSRLGDDKEDGYFLGFDTKEGEHILIKVAISYVSIEGARRNLRAELPHWDFDKVRADAKAAWNKELAKIEVSGGTPEQTTNFYTALYHTMIHPNVFNDVDGRYLGHDRKIHQLPGYDRVSSPHVSKGSASVSSTRGATVNTAFRPGSEQRPDQGAANWPPANAGGSDIMQKPAREQGLNTGRSERTAPSAQSGGHPSFVRRGASEEHYTVFSLWDTFRAAHPLYTIIDQRRTVDFINTFLRIYEQVGRLPVWELWGEETDTMIGYHAVSVIADAMAKGIKGFDYEKAYKAAKHSAELDHHGLAAYKKRGYVSSEDDNESVSKTLEYAYNDWCLMSMASRLFNQRSLGTGKNIDNDEYLRGLAADIERYRQRAGNFQNLFDDETRFFRPKRNGGFIKPFAPQEVTFHFTRATRGSIHFLSRTTFPV